MGLVIQAPAEPTALPGVAATATHASNAGNDVFATLLQSLLGESIVGPVPAPAAATGADLALPGAATKEGEKDDNPLGDALAAAVALLQLLSQPFSSPSAAVAPQGDAASASVPGPLVTNSAIAGAPPEETAGFANAVPATDSGPTATDAAATTTIAAATTVTEAAAAAPQQPAAVAITGVPAAPSTPLEPNAGTARGEDKTPGPDDPPPTEAGTTPADATQPSVVRFVGNAQHESHSGQGNAGDGRPNPGDANVVHPHASAEGIAHAAPNSPVGQLRADPAAAPADGPQATPPAPEIPQPVHQVSQAVLEQIGRGDGEARIHLDPVELGEVTIRVKTEGDHVRVEVHAERAEAMNLLRDHSADLSSLLGSRGLNLSDVYVGLGGHGARNSQGGEQQQRGERPANGQFAAILGTGEAPAVELHNRLRTAYNPDGAISYRV